MLKVEVERNGCWVERDPPPTFWTEPTEGGGRLRISVPRQERSLFGKLLARLEAPIQLLYVLHTSRGEGQLGRYQSEALSQEKAETFVSEFEGFLSADARADLWARSAASGDVLVWDRHNDIYAYGAPQKFKEQLTSHGFSEAVGESLGVHRHHYRAEFDEEASAVLSALEWRRTPLRPEDEQYVPPVANDC